MPSDGELMDIQVETLFVHDQNGRLLYINEPDGEKPLAPRFFLGRTRMGNIRRFRYDLPDRVVRRLDDLFALEPIAADLRDPPVHFEGYKDILQAHAEVQNVWAGPAYQFPDEVKSPPHLVRINESNAEILRDGFPDMIAEVEVSQPFMAVVEKGQAVSVCHSVRLSSQACEAGVDTLEGYRGRGHATAVVAGWAVAVRELGRIPLYSTSWENVASQGVTRKLDLMMYGVDLHFT